MSIFPAGRYRPTTMYFPSHSAIPIPNSLVSFQTTLIQNSARISLGLTIREHSNFLMVKRTFDVLAIYLSKMPSSSIESWIFVIISRVFKLIVPRFSGSYSFLHDGLRHSRCTCQVFTNSIKVISMVESILFSLVLPVNNGAQGHSKFIWRDGQWRYVPKTGKWLWVQILKYIYGLDS